MIRKAELKKLKKSWALLTFIPVATKYFGVMDLSRFFGHNFKGIWGFLNHLGQIKHHYSTLTKPSLLKKKILKQAVPWCNLKEDSTFYVQQVFLVLNPWPFFWAQRGLGDVGIVFPLRSRRGIAEVRLMLKTPPAPPFLTPSTPAQASPALHRLWSPPSQS